MCIFIFYYDWLIKYRYTEYAARYAEVNTSSTDSVFLLVKRPIITLKKYIKRKQTRVSEMIGEHIKQKLCYAWIFLFLVFQRRACYEHCAYVKLEQECIIPVKLCILLRYWNIFYSSISYCVTHVTLGNGYTQNRVRALFSTEFLLSKINRFRVSRTIYYVLHGNQWLVDNLALGSDLFIVVNGV